MHRQPLPYSPDDLRTKLGEIGCEITQERTLKSLPGSTHWHITKQGERTGVLEATWTPKGEAWLSYHDNRFRPWITEALAQLA